MTKRITKTIVFINHSQYKTKFYLFSNCLSNCFIPLISFAYVKPKEEFQISVKRLTALLEELAKEKEERIALLF